MQMVSEVMTRDVRFVSPQESLQRAAQMMDELNVGALPVCDGERLVGMVTDRDITVRATAAGRAPGEAHVDEVMSTDVRWCFEDQPLDEVMRQMSDTQVRRIPVVSHDESHKLVGIVALGDLVTKTADGTSRDRAEQVVGKISSPSEPDRSVVGARPDSRHVDDSAASNERLASNTGTATGFAGTDALLAKDEHPLEDRDDAGKEVAIGSERATKNTAATGGAKMAQTAGTTDISGESGAPGGTDAAGAVGASGGTAGTAGSAGTGIGAKP
ncbi:CBS domain-containing protein [Herbaspirillum sp. GCM10030257]|uniref:CBS domain-containing protein n=1 Tax=Herbaspirillum sp. GCM10030257 TaxID=3273393 RepID=UPI00360906C2